MISFNTAQFNKNLTIKKKKKPLIFSKKGNYNSQSTTTKKRTFKNQISMNVEQKFN